MPAKCRVSGCGWTNDHPLEAVSGSMATWHVYEKHHDVWRNIFGNRPPVDPDPRTDDGMAIAMAMEVLDAL